jgi:4-hydroxybenzoate polyprenyltransferase
MGASDILAGGWLARLPQAWRPYAVLARLDRPAGWWLLYLPGVWGIALAADPWPDPRLLALFLVGAIVMRAAGCVINDFWDRAIDRMVERTRNRPLASGAVTAMQALVFLAVLLAIGLAILLQLNWASVALGAVSLIPVVLYPLMKRITWWPQFFLGITFNWGAPLGYLAATGELSASAIVLYLAGIAWTLGYDTIYALQDIADDEMIGVKSTARLFGRDGAQAWVGVFYFITILLLFLCGGLAKLGWPFLPALLLAAVHLGWQVQTLDADDAAGCARRFRSNRDAGLLIAAAIMLGQFG